LAVNRLIRVSFGPFQLLELEPGSVEQVKRRVLIDQLGPRVARELGLDDKEQSVRPKLPSDGRYRKLPARKKHSR
jgi:23S rRNA pseudouridine2605 synthase